MAQHDSSMQANKSYSPPVDAMLRATVDYAKAGVPVFPLHTVDTKGQCTCSRRICGNPGKHPRTANGLSNATTDEFKIRQWWRRWPDSNIGLRTGVAFVAFDTDDGDEGIAEAK